MNNYDNFDMACPFGGTKESGWGREKGEYALENYVTYTQATPHHHRRHLRHHFIPRDITYLCPLSSLSQTTVKCVMCPLDAK